MSSGALVIDIRNNIIINELQNILKFFIGQTCNILIVENFTVQNSELSCFIQTTTTSEQPFQNIFDAFYYDTFRSELFSGFGIKCFFYILVNKPVFESQKTSANKLAAQLFVDTIRMKFFIKRFNGINNFNLVVYSAETQVFIFFKCAKSSFFLYTMIVINNDRLAISNPHFVSISFCKNSNNLFVRICLFESNIIL